MSMASEAWTMGRRLGSLLGRACGAAHGGGEGVAGCGDFRLTSADGGPAIMVAGRRSPVAGRRSPKSRVPACPGVRAVVPPKPLILSV